MGHNFIPIVTSHNNSVNYLGGLSSIWRLVFFLLYLLFGSLIVLMRTGPKTTSSVGASRRPSGSGRSPSPKVDLSTSKKLNESKQPAPSPRHITGNKLLRKSPSNIAESNFLAHNRSSELRNRSYNSNSFHDMSSRHDDMDFEQASVQSVFNEGQLSKIKQLVESQKRELLIDDYEPSDHIAGKHFHTVSASRSRPVEYDSDVNLASGNDFNDSCGIFHMDRSSSQHLVEDSRDDCAVSDITTEATYMNIADNNTQRHKNQGATSSASVLTTFEAASLSEEQIEHMMKALAAEKARRAQLAAANSADALNVRKNVKRSKSGGNESMLQKKSHTSAAPSAGDGNRGHNPPTSLPSFHTFRQAIRESSGIESPDPIRTGYHEAATDREVERAFQHVPGHNNTLQPALSSSPHIHGSNSLASSLNSNSLAASLNSPAGAYLMSNRGSQSRSGANIPADKMWNDHSPSQSSPLVYVESPITAGVTSLGLNSSGRISAAPIASDRDSRVNSNDRPPSFRGMSSDTEDFHHNSGRNSGGSSVNTPSSRLKMLETYREAMHYSSHHPEESAPVSAAPIRQQVVHVEKFTPLEMTSRPEPHGHSGSGKSHGSNNNNNSTHHAQTHNTHKDSVPIMRPSIFARSVSIGSDASSVDGLNMMPLAGPGRNQDMRTHYDALLTRDVPPQQLNREQLVSPLCAFDDCASLGSWSLNSGSRRSSTSRKQPHKSHNSHKSSSEKAPHYLSATVSSHSAAKFSSR